MIKNIKRSVRTVVLLMQYLIYTKLYKMNIEKSAKIAFSANIDKTYSQGIHIDEESYVARGAIIFSHDFSRSLHTDTYIGKRCFIGANAIVMAGVTIGDEVIIGSGSIVTKDIPSNSIAVGNPARVIKSGIKTKKYGQLADELNNNK